jgi:hypothetical protein
MVGSPGHSVAVEADAQAGEGVTPSDLGTDPEKNDFWSKFNDAPIRLNSVSELDEWGVHRFCFSLATLGHVGSSAHGIESLPAQRAVVVPTFYPIQTWCWERAIQDSESETEQLVRPATHRVPMGRNGKDQCPSAVLNNPKGQFNFWFEFRKHYVDRKLRTPHGERRNGSRAKLS